MKLMGEHFGELAEKQEAERAQQQAAAEMMAPALTPEQRKAQEVAQTAMADPEVREILQDGRVQQLLQKMQMGKPFELERELRTDPDIVRKLRKLSAAGLLNMEWQP
jgi:PBP1b-binding outer membrane lipoprotein LpoB